MNRLDGITGTMLAVVDRYFIRFYRDRGFVKGKSKVENDDVCCHAGDPDGFMVDTALVAENSSNEGGQRQPQEDLQHRQLN
jgi:hypothetical protein